MILLDRSDSAKLWKSWLPILMLWRSLDLMIGESPEALSKKGPLDLFLRTFLVAVFYRQST